MSRSPNYILKVFHSTVNNGTTVELPAGSFVRPIDAIYLPVHITDTLDFRWHNPETSVFCYTQFGIVLIPRDKLREV